MSLRFFVALASVWTCCCVAAGPTGVAATAERATAPVVVTPLTVSLKRLPWASFALVQTRRGEPAHSR